MRHRAHGLPLCWTASVLQAGVCGGEVDMDLGPTKLVVCKKPKFSRALFVVGEWQHLAPMDDPQGEAAAGADRTLAPPYHRQGSCVGPADPLRGILAVRCGHRKEYMSPIFPKTTVLGHHAWGRGTKKMSLARRRECTIHNWVPSNLSPTSSAGCRTSSFGARWFGCPRQQQSVKQSSPEHTVRNGRGRVRDASETHPCLQFLSCETRPGHVLTSSSTVQAGAAWSTAEHHGVSRSSTERHGALRSTTEHTPVPPPPQQHQSCRHCKQERPSPKQCCRKGRGVWVAS
eukprot:gene15378-biopygen18696